jgi:hypothetical protein
MIPINVIRLQCGSRMNPLTGAEGAGGCALLVHFSVLSYHGDRHAGQGGSARSEQIR